MALIGNITEYDASTTDWETYQSIFENFLVANAIDAPVAPAGAGPIPADRRKAVLLACIGHKTVNLLGSLCVPDTTVTKTFEQLLELLNSHFKPKKTRYAARHSFHSRKQREAENMPSMQRTYGNWRRNASVR